MTPRQPDEEPNEEPEDTVLEVHDSTLEGED